MHVLRLLLMFAAATAVAVHSPAWAATPAAKAEKQVLPAAESLRYTINWPSGLSLGEGAFKATRSKEGVWEIDLSIDASVPGFQVLDHYHSTANADLCAVSLEKTYVHGKRKATEKTTFDLEKSEATRVTRDGGKSTAPVSACEHDALSFLQFVRRELALGRLTPQHRIVFGSPYEIRLDYKGPQAIKVADVPYQADRIEATLKGPSTNLTFELFFARDAGRTPLMARVPLALGAFTMELVP
jgi:hypothetical protein